MNWNAKEFIWLDWVVLAIGILLVAVAVYRSIMKDKKKMKGADSQDYLFGKGEPWWVIGAAIFAANIGSEHLVGLAGTGAKDGVGMAHWEMQGWMILILGWLFVPFYQLLNNKLGRIITMPEFLKFRYTKATGSWLSIITLVAYVLTKVSVTAFTGGIFFEYLLGIPFWYGALGLIFITAVFTIFGGMKGVMTMSAIQTPILIIGSFLVLFLGLATLGDGSITQGWSNMMTYCSHLHNGYGTTHMFHWEQGDPMYHQYPGFVVFLGASIIGFWYWCTDQHIVQRVLGQTRGEDNREVMKRARRGTICAGYFKLLPVFMFLIPGMVERRHRKANRSAGGKSCNTGAIEQVAPPLIPLHKQRNRLGICVFAQIHLMKLPILQREFQHKLFRFRVALQQFDDPGRVGIYRNIVCLGESRHSLLCPLPLRYGGRSSCKLSFLRSGFRCLGRRLCRTTHDA